MSPGSSCLVSSPPPGALVCLFPPHDRIPLMALLLRSALTALALGLLAGPAFPQEPVRLAQTPDISPDGRLVAFSYLGDIWVVDAAGGTARAVTSHPAHDSHPVFSPDGRSLAFSSN